MNQDKQVAVISFSELKKKLWGNRRFIIKYSAVAIVIGLIVAFSVPKEYTTTVLLTSESTTNMGALASLTGFNMGENAGADLISPDLYPNILSSTPFIQGLFQLNVIDRTQDINTTFYQYMKDEQKVAWWTYLFKAPGAVLSLLIPEEDSSEDNGPLYISKEDMGIITDIKDLILINSDSKTGLITLDITAQSPTISAQLADTLSLYLQSYLIEQRTKKAKNDLDNTKRLYKEAKEYYYETRENLAKFVDRNINITENRYRIRQEALENECRVAYSTYTQMAQQTQMAEIKVQDDTPVFTIIQPAVEPIYPSTLSKGMTLFIFVFISLIITTSWTFREEIKRIILGVK